MNIKESHAATGSKESTLPATTFIDVFYHRGLPSEERRKFITWATEIALDAFGRKDAVEFRKSVLAVLQNHFVVFLLKGDLPFAFISTYCFKAESMGVMYIEGMAVKKDYQGNGVANKLVETAFDSTRLDGRHANTRTDQGSNQSSGIRSRYGRGARRNVRFFQKKYGISMDDRRPVGGSSRRSN